MAKLRRRSISSLGARYAADAAAAEADKAVLEDGIVGDAGGGNLLLLKAVTLLASQHASSIFVRSMIIEAFVVVMVAG